MCDVVSIIIHAKDSLKQVRMIFVSLAIVVCVSTLTGCSVGNKANKSNHESDNSSQATTSQQLTDEQQVTEDKQDDSAEIIMRVTDISASMKGIMGTQESENGNIKDSFCEYTTDTQYYAADHTSITLKQFSATIKKNTSHHENPIKCRVSKKNDVATEVNLLDDIEIVDSYEIDTPTKAVEEYDGYIKANAANLFDGNCEFSLTEDTEQYTHYKFSQHGNYYDTDDREISWERFVSILSSDARSRVRCHINVQGNQAIEVHILEN